MFSIVKFNISDTKLKQFVAALSPDGEGSSVMVSDFIRHAEALDMKKVSKVAKKDQKNFNNIRRFLDTQKIYEHLGSVIVEKRFTDFGPLLKGHDFYNKVDTIFDQFAKKFKKVGVVLDSIVEELQQKDDVKSEKEKKRIR
jgi:hypothetical protein